MIQETFDCLLTRAFFINNDSDEILKSIDSKEIFTGLIERTSSLMQQEDFFLIKEEYQEKLSLVIQEYRFKYNDETINDDINYIIIRLNKYKNMSQERKIDLINQFYKDQYTIRNMPKSYQVPCNIDKFMIFDFLTLIQLFPQSNDENNTHTLEIFNIVEFISLMNILLNKNTDIFFLEGFFENTVNNLNSLLVYAKDWHTLKYLKNTIKNIKKLEKGKYKVVTI